MKKLLKSLFVAGLFLSPVSVFAQEQVLDEGGYSITSGIGDKLPNSVGADELYIEVNNNEPFFTDKDKSAESTWIEFGDLDSQGRVTLVNAVLDGESLMVNSSDKFEYEPTGWSEEDHLAKTELISSQLVGETVEKLNLFTATKYMKEEGLQNFVSEIKSALKDGQRVRYRATAFYTVDNPVTDGILMEAYSITDGGKSLSFNVFIPNQDKDNLIDQATGSIAEPRTAYQLEGTSSQAPQATFLYYSQMRDESLKQAAAVTSNTADLPSLNQSYIKPVESSQNDEGGCSLSQSSSSSSQGFYQPSSSSSSDTSVYYDDHADTDDDYYQEPAPVQERVYYKNCSEARAAGAAPIYRGEPGYASHLDRDNDGIACE